MLSVVVDRINKTCMINFAQMSDIPNLFEVILHCQMYLEFIQLAIKGSYTR